MDMEDYYSSEITSVTREEFLKFVKWYNKHIGHEPMIVGGWAVFTYAPLGRGSKDVDVIFPGREAMDTTLGQFFHSEGYKEKRTSLFGGTEFVKEIRTKNGKNIDMIIDATTEDIKIKDENTGIILDWSPTKKNRERKEYYGAVFYVPTVELLIAYKLGALIKRETALRITGDFVRYSSKILKDVSDVLWLCHDRDIDNEKLMEFITEMKMKKYLKEIEELVERYARDAKAEEFLQEFKNKFGKLIKG